jgi:heme-degrading monooxygenase HmoA
MYTRIVSFNGATDIDAGVEFLRETVIPMLDAQSGFLGVIASAHRSQRIFAVLSLWATEADRALSDTALSAIRKEAAEVIGGELTVDNYESMIAEMGDSPPRKGSALGVTQLQMEPSRADENVEYFRTEVVPEIRALPGFQSLRHMINRETGAGVVGMAWDSPTALAHSADVLKRRRAMAEGRGVTLSDISVREILLVDLRG